MLPWRGYPTVSARTRERTRIWDFAAVAATPVSRYPCESALLDHYRLARAECPSHAPTSRIPRGVFLFGESMTTYQVFDTTLRDGAQREGITYSVVDKLTVARLLDELSVGFIEGGWPGAMPKDTEFFRRARTELDLKHAILVAFGATRRADLKADSDPQIRALLDAETP